MEDGQDSPTTIECFLWPPSPVSGFLGQRNVQVVVDDHAGALAIVDYDILARFGNLRPFSYRPETHQAPSPAHHDRVFTFMGYCTINLLEIHADLTHRGTQVVNARVAQNLQCDVRIPRHLLHPQDKAGRDSNNGTA